MELSINNSNGQIFEIYAMRHRAHIVIGRFTVCFCWSKRGFVCPAGKGDFYQIDTVGGFVSRNVTIGRFQFNFEVEKRESTGN